MPSPTSGGGGCISKETFNELKLLIEGFLNPVAKEKQMLSVIETILRKTYQALKKGPAYTHMAAHSNPTEL